MAKKFGNLIVPKGANVEPHEIETALFFNKLGFDVEFLIPVDEDHIKTPDIRMDELLWEIKSPQNNGKYTIIHSLKKALLQSNNVIFDLRRSQMFEPKAISQLKEQFELTNKIKNLYIITKSRLLIDLKK